MSDYDTVALLSDIRELGSLPASDARFTNALLLTAATKEMRDKVVPLLTQARTEHLVYDYSVPVVSGTQAYRIPSRAVVGGGMRDVSYVDTFGNPKPLTLLSSDQVYQIGGSNNRGTPYAYFVRNYSIHLVPIPNVAGTLRMPYYARPNALVLPSATVVIYNVATVSPGLYRITFVDNPANIAIANNSRLDVVRGTPGFETLEPDAVTSNVDQPGGGFATVDVAISNPVNVPAGGDYLCLPGQAPVPQIPVELHGLLSSLTALRALKAVGDDRWQALKDDVSELQANAKSLLNTRTSGDTQQAGGGIEWAGLVAF